MSGECLWTAYNAANEDTPDTGGFDGTTATTGTTGTTTTTGSTDADEGAAPEDEEPGANKVTMRTLEDPAVAGMADEGDEFAPANEDEL